VTCNGHVVNLTVYFGFMIMFPACHVKGCVITGVLRFNL